MLIDWSVSTEKQELVSHKIHTESLALLLSSAHTYKSCVPRVVEYYSVSSRTSDVCTFCPFLFSSCSHQHDNSLIMCHCKFDCGMPLSQSTDGGTRSVSHLTDQLSHTGQIVAHGQSHTQRIAAHDQLTSHTAFLDHFELMTARSPFCRLGLLQVSLPEWLGFWNQCKRI